MEIDFCDIFSYSDGEIFWKVKFCKKILIGGVAGTKRPSGYRYVLIKGKQFAVHRVIWEMHFGKIKDGMQIDHINHIRYDNRIENLRVVSSAENSRNRSISSINKSGSCGVSYDKKRNRWRSYIVFDGEFINIGYFKSYDDAAKKRKQFESALGFHKNHGNK